MLKELSEREILDSLKEFLSPGGVLPYPEDAFGMELSDGSAIITNVDALTKQNDFLPGMPYEALGYRIVTQCHSDLCAKGVFPSYFCLAALTNTSMLLEDFLEIIKGVKRANDDSKTSFLGGDLSTTGELVLVGTSIGIAPSPTLIRRTGAQIGDLVCVSGEFGWVGLGFSHLLENVQISEPHVLEEILHRTYWPKSRIDLIEKLKKWEVTSAIDSSDGLARSLWQLSEGTNIGIEIENSPAPDIILKLCDKLSIDPNVVVFHSGDEYELVFTIPERMRNQLDSSIIEIGKVIDGRGVQFEGRELPNRGWDAIECSIKNAGDGI